MLKQVKCTVKTEIEYRPATTGSAGAGEDPLGKFFALPWKMCWT